MSQPHRAASLVLLVSSCTLIIQKRAGSNVQKLVNLSNDDDNYDGDDRDIYASVQHVFMESDVTGYQKEI